MAVDRSLAARAQQIIHVETSHGKTLTGLDAMRTAIAERCAGNLELAIEMAATFAAGWEKDARKATYNLPEDPTLFDLPPTIAVSTPLGDLYLSSEDATAGQVDQWAREGQQYHGGQHRRFKSMRASLKAAALDPSDNYKAQLKAIKSKDTDQ